MRKWLLFVLFLALSSRVDAITWIADTYINTSGNITGSYLFGGISCASIYGNSSDLCTIAAGTGNTSWNETRGNALYYPLSNPFGYLNTSGGGNTTNQIFAVCNNNTFLKSEADPNYFANPSDYVNYTQGNTTDEIFSVCDNSTFLKDESLWSANYTNLNDSWSNTFNKTYDEKITDNASWNETRANGLYYSVSNPYGFLNITTNESYYLVSNPFSFINDTTWQYNQTTSAIDWVQAQNYYTNCTNTSYLIGESLWNGNYSSVAFNNISNVSNSTLFFGGLASSGYYTNCTNASYATDRYNSSYNALLSNISATSNNSLFFNGIAPTGYYTNCTNTSYMTNTANTSYLLKAGDTMTGNLNISTQNLTLYNNAGGKIKFYNSTGVASCIYANDTYSLIISSSC